MVSQTGLGVVEWRDCGVSGRSWTGKQKGWLVGSMIVSGRAPQDIAAFKPRKWEKKRKDATLTLTPVVGEMDKRAKDEIVVGAIAMMEALRKEGMLAAGGEGVEGVGEVVGALAGA